VSGQKESQETNSSSNAAITLHDRMLVEDTTLFRGKSTRTATYRGESGEEWSTKYFLGGQRPFRGSLCPLGRRSAGPSSGVATYF